MVTSATPATPPPGAHVSAKVPAVLWVLTTPVMGGWWTDGPDGESNRLGQVLNLHNRLFCCGGSAIVPVFIFGIVFLNCQAHHTIDV